MHMNTRRIGRIGTTTRLLAAAGLLYLAFFDGASWGLEWYDAAVGLGVLPAAMIAFGLGARRYASGPVHFAGSAGTTANCLILIALAVNPYTAGGAALFYATTLLVAAWRAQPRLRGHRALERDPRPRRPGRLPGLLANRQGRGTSQRTKVGEGTPAATGRLLDREQVAQRTRRLGRPLRRPLGAAE